MLKRIFEKAILVISLLVYEKGIICMAENDPAHRDYFADNYLPVELQKHILQLTLQRICQQSSTFADLLENTASFLKNVGAVNKKFRSFKNELINYFLAKACEYLKVDDTFLSPAEKNEMLREALTGEKNEENAIKALKAVLIGADVNLLITAGLETPRSVLAWATLWPSPELVTLLLIRGANIDFQNINGYTALMQAVSEGYEDIVKILLHHKAKVILENKYRQTALKIAYEKGKVSIIDMLSKEV